MGAPYSTVVVTANENIKKVVKPKECKNKFTAYFACAFTSGAIASTVTMPLDNIKTRMQTQQITSSCEKIASRLEGDLVKSAIYKDIFSTCSLIYRQEGFIRGFYKGTLARSLFTSPSAAISWGSYEIVKHALWKE